MNNPQMGLSRLGKLGKIAIATSALTLASTPASMLPAQAQTLILDGTTGPAQTLTGPVYEIEQALGTTAGANLFHSFEQFDLGTGERANFGAAPEVRNILTRVTGGAASTIDGAIATPGSTADFYLINPAGMVFGPGGKLELGGSFIGTTASAVRFGEVGEFSAVQPQAAELLTIAPSALRFSENAGQIVSQSVVTARPSPTEREQFGLQVPEGKSLLLVGGDIEIDGGGVGSGGLLAVGGRLELGGLAEMGEVQLAQVGQTLGLKYPQDKTLADVQVINNALVTVIGTGGGDLVVNAARLIGSAGGRLRAGTGGAGDGGELIINAKEIEFRGGFGGQVSTDGFRSSASNDVIAGGTGNGGELRIVGDRLSLSEGAQLGNSIFGTGSTGDVVLEIKEAIDLDGTAATANNGIAGTGIYNDLQNGSPQSRGGKLIIRTQRLNVRNGAQISTSLFKGQGQAGAIEIEAQEVVLNGLAPSADPGSAFVSSIASIVGEEASGTGGAIQIQTERLSILNAADINTSVRGQGQGGEISIEAKESIEVVGTEQLDQDDSLFFSAIQANLLPGATGESGQISIISPSLSLRSGGTIESLTFQSVGNAGAIQIKVDQLEMLERRSDGSYSGRIASSSSGVGNAGNILIEADSISLRDSGQINSSILPASEQTTELAGDGGTIQIDARSLEVTDSIISSSSSGNGNAGDIRLNAEQSFRLNDGFIGATVISEPDGGVEATGNGGEIEIQAGSFEMQDSSILSDQQGSGNRAGSVSIRVEKDAVLRSSLISTSVGEMAVGEGGALVLETGSLSAVDSNLLAATRGAGAAGSVTLQSQDNISLQGGTFVATASIGNKSGPANDIRIKAKSLAAVDGVEIISFTVSNGDAGNIEIETSQDLVVERSRISAETVRAGAGGTIRLVSPEIELNDGSAITAASFSQGRVGSVAIQADTLRIQNQSEISFVANSPEIPIDGGTIDIDLASALLLRDNSAIFATAADQTPQGGSGGTINIAAPFIFSIPSRNGDISTSGIGGDGGRINIDAEGVFNFKIAPQNGPTAAELRRNTDNDISSNSQVTQGGTVLVSGLNVDPAQGAAELPINFTDPSQQIAQRCANTAASSSFISTGRSGIPLNPTDAQTLSNTEADWAALPPAIAIAQVQASPAEPAAASTEVTHWQRDPEGNIVLLATQPVRPTFDLAQC